MSPRPPRPPRRGWQGPPEHSAGVLLASSIKLAHNQRVAVFVRGFVVFIEGVLFDLHVLYSDPVADVHSFHHRDVHEIVADDGTFRPEVLRFGVQYPDGRTVAPLGRPGPYGGDGITLMQQGGGPGPATGSVPCRPRDRSHS